MKSLWNELNNRDVAILIWFAVFAVSILFIKEIRQSLIGVFRAFLSWKIQLIFFSQVIYTSVIVYLLYRFGFWDQFLLKDSIVWFFGVAFLFVFRMTAGVRGNFFIKIALDCLKWTIVVEFIANLYVFSLPIEIVIVFLLVLSGMMKPLAEREEKYKDVNKCLSWTFSILLTGVTFFSIVKTLIHFMNFFSVDNMKSIALSPVLTLLYLPLLYLIALIMQYETLFVRIDCIFADKIKVRAIQSAIRKVAGLNINRLNRINKNFIKKSMYNTDDIEGYIKSIASDSAS